MKIVFENIESGKQRLSEEYAANKRRGNRKCLFGILMCVGVEIALLALTVYSLLISQEDGAITAGVIYLITMVAGIGLLITCLNNLHAFKKKMEDAWRNLAMIQKIEEKTVFVNLIDHDNESISVAFYQKEDPLKVVHQCVLPCEVFYQICEETVKSEEQVMKIDLQKQEAYLLYLVNNLNDLYGSREVD